MARLLNRYLKLVFTRSDGKSNYHLTLTSDEIYFTVKVNKYMSHLKDEIVIEIWNLSSEYQTLLKQYDTVSVYAGREMWYDENRKEKKQWIQHLVAVQTVLSQTNDKSNLSSLKTILVCSSRFRSRNIKPITLKNGISLWNAINFIVKRASLKSDVNVELKNRVLQKPLSIQNISSAINNLIRDYPFIKIKNDSDGIYDIVFDYVNNRKSRSNIIISPQNRTLIKDWVSIDANGDITFTSLPNIISFKVGDGISVNSQYINSYISSTSNYTDKIKIEKRLERTIQEQDSDTINFEYIIISLGYDLDVRGNWEVKVKARPRTSFNQKVVQGAL